MKTAHSVWTPHGGFTLAEVVVVLALIGIVSLFAVPMLLSYVQAERTQGSAREIQAWLNEARNLAVTQNTSYSVEIQTNPQNRMRFCSGTAVPCAANIWVGSWTDDNGWMTLANNDRIVLGPQITFSSLGGGSTAGTIRVQNAQGTSCLDVVVSPTGRIRLAASATCP